MGLLMNNTHHTYIYREAGAEWLFHTHRNRDTTKNYTTIEWFSCKVWVIAFQRRVNAAIVNHYVYMLKEHMVETILSSWSNCVGSVLVCCIRSIQLIHITIVMKFFFCEMENCNVIALAEKTMSTVLVLGLQFSELRVHSAPQHHMAYSYIL